MFREYYKGGRGLKKKYLGRKRGRLEREREGEGGERKGGRKEI